MGRLVFGLGRQNLVGGILEEETFWIFRERLSWDWMLEDLVSLD